MRIRRWLLNGRRLGFLTRFSFVGLVLALVAAPGCDNGRAVSNSELAGTYERRHKVFVFHGNEPVEVEATDELVLEAGEEGGLAIRLHLVVDGGECRLQTTATSRRGGFESRGRTDGCRLRVEPVENGLLVEDVDALCRPHACTGHAAIGRVVFPRSSTDPTAPAPR